jgi:hypothetical protein
MTKSDCVYYAVRADSLPIVQFTSTKYYLLAPWSRVLLQKLTVNFATSQEISRIYGTRNFLTIPLMPAICLDPEPTPSSPHDPLQPPEDPS